MASTSGRGAAVARQSSMKGPGSRRKSVRFKDDHASAGQFSLLSRMTPFISLQRVQQ